VYLHQPELHGRKRPAIMVLHGDVDKGMPLEADSKIIKEMLP
jgi:hypothetical protein